MPEKRDQFDESQHYMDFLNMKQFSVPNRRKSTTDHRPVLKENTGNRFQGKKSKWVELMAK